MRDHPRVCGENNPYITAYIINSGSPPRMRGKLPLHNAIIAHIRITPADAGKTCLCSPAQRARPDHPRGCGENWQARLKETAQAGSPPRMRGKPRRQTIKCCNIRITPADAGKTTRHRRSHRRSRDHPRGCGENMILVIGMHSGSGSPPRMRGKPDH